MISSHSTPDLFSTQHSVPAQDDEQTERSLPATERQVGYARVLAARSGARLPRGIETDRRALSKWIETQSQARPGGRFADYPSSRQVAFAERIARLKRSSVPQECFRDRTLMSRWIDSNKP